MRWLLGKIKDLIEPLHASVIDKVISTWVTTQRWRRVDLVVDRQAIEVCYSTITQCLNKTYY